VDHSRWAHEASRIEGAVLHVPAAEWRYLADVDHFVERCGIEDAELAISWKTWLTDFAGLRPVPSAVPLSPGETIDLGGIGIEVVDAAGHSPGHQAYWIARERILFCVDIGVDAYVRSIRRLADLDARLLVTSHGGIVETRIRETILGCLEVMRWREGIVARELDAGLGVEEIGARGHIYGDVSRFPPPLDRAYRLWEENMVREHARILETGGLDRIGV
jgi:glyoxylase-like metal-dependent hydrolase (beta-lactamase superfamily II)